MPKVNRQAGIHLHKTKVLNRVRKRKGVASNLVISNEYYWILIARNGKTIAEGKPYKRKAGAVASIRVAAKVFRASFGMFGGHFFDHTSKNGSKVDAYIF